MKRNYVLLSAFIVIATQPAAHAMLRGAARAAGAAARTAGAAGRAGAAHDAESVAAQFARVTLSDGASAVGRGVARCAPVRGAASGAAGAAQSAGQGASWGRVAGGAVVGGAVVGYATQACVRSYVHSRDEQGDTPLHRAALRGDVEKMQLLLRLGASVHAENRDGRTPLLCAVSAREVEAVRVLLREGAKINHADGHGDTALHIAAKDPKGLEIWGILAIFGANTHIKNVDDESPFDVLFFDGEDVFVDPYGDDDLF